MRCQHCGSRTVYSDTQHKNFSAGKAAAGAVLFGAVGAAAGVIGKDIKGYRCGVCGAFQESPMEFGMECAIDSAIEHAESGRDIATYNYYKKQYPNIENVIIPTSNVSVQASSFQDEKEIVNSDNNNGNSDSTNNIKIKNNYGVYEWDPTSPVYIEMITILTNDEDDCLIISAYNQDSRTIRSAYLKVTSYDDTGDEISTLDCVYQGIDLESGNQFPIEPFRLKTGFAYRVSLVLDKVAFSNGEVWRNHDSSNITIEPSEICDSVPRYSYLKKEVLAITNLNKDDKLYYPAEYDGYWKCICGKPVRTGNKCPFCGADYKQLIEVMDQKHLIDLQKVAIKERATERALKTTEMYEEACRNAYDKALQLSKCRDINKLEIAISIFDRLPADYNDSSVRREKAEKWRKELVEKKRMEQEEAERAAEEAHIARERAAEEQRQEHERQKRKKLMKICLIIFIIVLIAAITIDLFVGW